MEIKGFKKISIYTGIILLLGIAIGLLPVILRKGGASITSDEGRDSITNIQREVKNLEGTVRTCQYIISEIGKNNSRIESEYRELESEHNRLRVNYSDIKSRSEELERINRELTNIGQQSIGTSGEVETGINNALGFLGQAREILQRGEASSSD